MELTRHIKKPASQQLAHRKEQSNQYFTEFNKFSNDTNKNFDSYLTNMIPLNKKLTKSARPQTGNGAPRSSFAPQISIPFQQNQQNSRTNEFGVNKLLGLVPSKTFYKSNSSAKLRKSEKTASDMDNFSKILPKSASRIKISPWNDEKIYRTIENFKIESHNVGVQAEGIQTERENKNQFQTCNFDKDL